MLPSIVQHLLPVWELMVANHHAVLAVGTVLALVLVAVNLDRRTPVSCWCGLGLAGMIFVFSALFWLYVDVGLEWFVRRIVLLVVTALILGGVATGIANRFRK